MARYDTEAFLKQLENVYQTNLNNEITLIDTEKSDFVLDKIDANAWYFQNLNNEVFSYDRFIVWGLENSPEVTSQQSDNFIKNIKVFIELAMQDGGEVADENIVWQLLRYTRALESVAFKNFDKFQSRGAKIQVESLVPTSFSLDGKLFRSAGVNISASLTAF